MAGMITEEDVVRYQEDGAIVLRSVFEQSWIEKIKEGIQVNL